MTYRPQDLPPEIKRFVNRVANGRSRLMVNYGVDPLQLSARVAVGKGLWAIMMEMSEAENTFVIAVDAVTPTVFGLPIVLDASLENHGAVIRLEERV